MNLQNRLTKFEKQISGTNQAPILIRRTTLEGEIIQYWLVMNGHSFISHAGESKQDFIKRYDIPNYEVFENYEETRQKMLKADDC